MTQKISSVLYIPDDADLWQMLSRLGEFAETRGWPVGCYTRSWQEVVQLLGTGDYQIGVTPSMSALPPDRLPRIVAADQDESLTPLQRRPRVRYPG